ncbi:MAG: inositol monophosphatase [Elusimicrobia bacterium]|nr:inositol monophosphatase [Elusimicrobiota bacterium]
MKEAEILKKAALKGGEILLKYFGKVGYSLKGKANLLTKADLESQRQVIKIIKKHFPLDSFLAEEDRENIGEIPLNPPFTKGDGKGDLTSIATERLWIIDPLDGTTNYAHGFPMASVSIGFMSDGKMIAGGIFDPFRKELFRAVKNKGAFLNSRKIKVSKTSRLSEALLVTGFPYDRGNKSKFYCSFYSRFMEMCHDIRRTGAASIDMAYTACGRFDGYWEFGLKPWDVSAGKIILEEAGGKMTDFSGKAHENVRDYGKETLVTNNRIHAEMLAVLRK